MPSASFTVTRDSDTAIPEDNPDLLALMTAVMKMYAVTPLEHFEFSPKMAPPPPPGKLRFDYEILRQDGEKWEQIITIENPFPPEGAKHTFDVGNAPPGEGWYEAHYQQQREIRARVQRLHLTHGLTHFHMHWPTP